MKHTLDVNKKFTVYFRFVTRYFVGLSKEEAVRKFDAKQAYNYSTSLSFPRLVGTPGEIRGRDFIQEEMAKASIATENSPFRFFPALSFGILKNLLAIGLAMLLLHRLALSAWPRFGALAGLLIPLIAQHLWKTYRRAAAEKLSDNRAAYSFHARFVSQASLQLRSANIIADLPCKGPVRRRLVFSAHTDSKSQNMSIVTRATCSIVFALGVFLLPLLTAPGLIWPAWLLGKIGFVWWVLWLAAEVCAVVLLTMKVTNESSGAMDDAAACGVLMETARALAAEPPDGVAVRIVWTGAEELGLAGALHYAQNLDIRSPWREAYHLNWEGVGGGTKIWLATGSGPGKEKESLPRKAVALAEAACRRCGVAPKKLSRLVGGEADHIPLLEAGLSTVTLMFSGAPATKVHTSGDRAEILSPESIELAGNIALTAVSLLEEGTIRE